jgi:hypothetical protein
MDARRPYRMISILSTSSRARPPQRYSMTMAPLALTLPVAFCRCMYLVVHDRYAPRQVQQREECCVHLLDKVVNQLFPIAQNRVGYGFIEPKLLEAGEKQFCQTHTHTHTHTTKIGWACVSYRAHSCTWKTSSCSTRFEHIIGQSDHCEYGVEKSGLVGQLREREREESGGGQNPDRDKGTLLK